MTRAKIARQGRGARKARGDERRCSRNQMNQLPATDYAMCELSLLLSPRRFLCPCRMSIGVEMGGGSVVASANEEMSVPYAAKDPRPVPVPIRAIPSLPRFSVHSHL